MGRPAARQGDPTAHGGTITGGCPTIFIEGKPAARVGDMHACPAVTGTVPHVGGPVLPPGDPGIFWGGQPAVGVGDLALCSGPPDSIVAGSATVFLTAKGAAGVAFHGNTSSNSREDENSGDLADSDDEHPTAAAARAGEAMPSAIRSSNDRNRSPFPGGSASAPTTSAAHGPSADAKSGSTLDNKKLRLWGLDVLGVGGFPRGGLSFKKLVAWWPQGWAAGIFAEQFASFKSGYEFATLLLASERAECPLIRVQLLWSDSHSFNIKALKRDVVKMAKEYERLARQYVAHETMEDGTTREFRTKIIELSAFCEHNINDADALGDLAKTIRDAAPTCDVVNSPWNGATIGGCIHETHNPASKPMKRRPYNFSYDGSSTVDEAVQSHKERHANCEVFFFWVPQFNMKRKTEWATHEGEVPIPSTKRTVVPTRKHIDALVYLANHDRADSWIRRGLLWKSHSDQQNPPTPRDGKPVLIVPARCHAEYFELRAIVPGKSEKRVGPLIARSSSGMDYNSGAGRRFYFPEWGYEMSRKALAAAKSKQTRVDRGEQLPCAMCELRGSDGHVYGQIDPAFRYGIYRSSKGYYDDYGKNFGSVDQYLLTYTPPR